MVPPERLKPTTLYLKTSTLPLVGSIGKYICLTFISACLLAKKEKKTLSEVRSGHPWQKFLEPRMGQPASKLGPLSACQDHVIRMAFHRRADNGPIVCAYWVSISFESYMFLFLYPGYVLCWCSVCFSERLILH